MVLGRKEKEVEELIITFFSQVKKTLFSLEKLIADYLKGDKVFKEDSGRIHEHEHEADRIRQDVLLKLLHGAFLPFYREDYIVLLVLGDEIANISESVAQLFVLTRPSIPAFMQDGLKEMVASTKECFEPLEKMINTYQVDSQKVPELTEKVRKWETKIDKLQWDLVKSVFKSDLPLAEKLHLREVIDMIASISDQIEDVGERLEIMLAKRPG